MSGKHLWQKGPGFQVRRTAAARPWHRYPPSINRRSEYDAELVIAEHPLQADGARRQTCHDMFFRRSRNLLTWRSIVWVFWTLVVPLVVEEKRGKADRLDQS